MWSGEIPVGTNFQNEARTDSCPATFQRSPKLNALVISRVALPGNGVPLTMRRPQTSRGSLARRQQQLERQLRQSPADIYEDLLDEALRSSPATPRSRPLKRRRSARGTDVIVIDDTESDGDGARGTKENGEGGRGHEVVVVESSTSSDGSEDEEMEWDNVDLTGVTSLDTPADSPPVREITMAKPPEIKTR